MVDYREYGKPLGGSVEMKHLYGVVNTLREVKVVRMEWFDSPREALCAGAEPVDVSADASTN